MRRPAALPARLKTRLELRTHRAVQVKDAGSRAERSHCSVRERARQPRTPRWAALCGALSILCIAASASSAEAAPPTISAAWSTEVAARTAVLHAEIDPGAATTTYHFSYLPEAAYRANLQAGREGFAGAAKAPAGADPVIGPGPVTVKQSLGALAPETAYRYRVLAGAATGAPHAFATESLGGGPLLLDGRGWEMVSPVDKNGGEIQGFGGNFGGDVLQAAADGESLTFSSRASFGAGAQGAPVASQYIARRSPAGWSTENITVPTLSGAYGDHPNGVPYQLFSADLARGLLLDGRRCAAAEPCPRSYSLRESAGGALTPLPEAAAGMRVFSASPDLGRIVFAAAGGETYEWSGGGLAPIAPPPPPSTGATRTSADGQTVAFLSTEPLTGYDNTDQVTGEPDSEVFLESAGSGGGGTLICASCNPTGERPLGPSTIPGAISNGAQPGATHLYKPRNLAADGRRLFFDSRDSLVLQDTDNAPDAYEWEAAGEGSCAAPGGCVGLISSGRDAEPSTFVDASADGSDAFFLTAASLVPADPGSADLYDAREGGGFPVPPAPIPCEGDACQSLPPEPEDPAPGTLQPNPGNPPLHFHKVHPHKVHHHKKRKHHHPHHKRGGRR